MKKQLKELEKKLPIYQKDFNAHPTIKKIFENKKKNV